MIICRAVLPTLRGARFARLHRLYLSVPSGSIFRFL